MDPLIGSAIIGGASKLIGNIFGKKNTDSANDANLKINQMNNEFNAREAEKAFQRESAYNDKIRAEDREYNSAKAQVERYREAGLNPTLMMQGQSAGVAQSNGVSGSAAQASGNAQMNAFQPDLDLSGTIHSFLALRQQKELQDEQINGIRIENQYKAQKIMADILNLKSQAKSNEARAKLDRTLEGLQGQIVHNQTITAEAQARQANESAELMIAERLLKSKELATFDAKFRREAALVSAQVLQYKAVANLSDKQAKHEMLKRLKTMADTQGVKVNNEVLKRTADAIVDKLYNEEYWSRYPNNEWQAIRYISDEVRRRINK